MSIFKKASASAIYYAVVVVAGAWGWVGGWVRPSLFTLCHGWQHLCLPLISSGALGLGSNWIR